MALDLSLPPYVLESVRSSDNFFTHYNATDSEDNVYIITEFFPAYMVTRGESGNLVVSERFQKEFDETYHKFVEMAREMHRMNDASTVRVENVIEMNNTAYIARRDHESITIDAYMKNQLMPFAEAYTFMRPMLLTLAAAEKKGILFGLAEGEIRVNRYGQPFVNTLFNWDVNRNTCISNLAKLYYRLITGQPCEAEPVPPAELNVDLPPRLETFLMDAVRGENLFGAIDGFYKQFRYLMENLVRNESGAAAGASPVLKWVAVLLSATLIFTISYFLVDQALIPAYRAVNSPGTGAAPAEPALEAPQVDPAARNFSAVAFTNPQDPNDILNGAFYEWEDALFYRAWFDGWCLSRRGANGADVVVVRDARPAYITAADDFIYYCDGLKGYGVYRVRPNGAELQCLTENTATNIRTDGRVLYYTNHDDADRLYRLDLATLEDEPLVRGAAYDTQLYEGRLFFLNSGRDSNVCAVDPQDPPALTLLTEETGDNLRFYDGKLFYIDLETQKVRCVTPEGRPVALNCTMPAYGFDGFGAWLAVIKADAWHLYAYNINSGEHYLLSGYLTAYVQVVGRTVYAIDYNDCRVSRQFTLGR